MTQAQLSVSWEEHLTNITNGLSSFQQNNDFVDMTLAADGYFVKVHKLIMALSSPYIKDLITSAECPHPVIFLNKISYTTLSSILEYIYTGEVLITIENLNDLLEAAKELHIKGLEDMDITRLLSTSSQKKQNLFSSNTSVAVGSSDITSPNEHRLEMEDMNEYDPFDEDVKHSVEEIASNLAERKEIMDTNNTLSKGEADLHKNMNTLQYTVSNQGSLQMILNRFMYYLKYTNKDNTRQWRCVDYLNTVKCPAYVMTKDDVVIQRTSAHSHPFHDKKIIKKLKCGTIFSALHKAQANGQHNKNKNDTNTE